MEEQKSRARDVFEWYDALVFALAVVVVLFLFGARIITVSGSSMVPTLYGGDHVLVQSMFYQPKRGDIVVVDGYSAYGDPLIKRVIGVGGDVVDIDFAAGTVTVNGEVQEEPYISAPTTLSFDVEFPLTVPEGHVFLMGDNRPNSKDSRASEIGCPDERELLGRVLLRVSPLDRLGKVV